jgi:hypothetical protein
MAKVLVNGLVIFATVWLVFAVWDINGEKGGIKVYSALTVVDRNSSLHRGVILPALQANSVYEYRVSETFVVNKIGDSVNKFEDCEIFDESNWSCTYSDDSATFGFRSGEYFERVNTEKFPFLASFDNKTYLSRFKYVILGCRWDWVDGPIQMIACLFRPFAF